MKRFNVTGICVKEKHYMVDISEKIRKVMNMIEREQYFTINRARQYGKTTTLFHLAKVLPEDYTCIKLSFEGVGDSMFESEESFCQQFLWHVSKMLSRSEPDFAALWRDETIIHFSLLSDLLDKVCQDRKIVLMIDEVDATSNNRVFLQFIGLLRNKYLTREDGFTHTFHSVILAGVYDIKNMKLKLINEGVYTQQAAGRLYNSPWNIAVHFHVDMSFSPAEIASMLSEYEADHQTGMDVSAISEWIHEYTSGYPFLVSRICQCIDEELDRDWTRAGVQKAVKTILQETNTLFVDLAKNLENNSELYQFLYAILILGERRAFVLTVPVIEWAHMFGYIKKEAGQGCEYGQAYAVIFNVIFQMLLTRHFIAKNENINQVESIVVSDGVYHEIVSQGRFDMPLCLCKFAAYYREIFSEEDLPFLERHGRLLFLSYLKPLINGQGFYHMESQFTDLRRMDIVVDFKAEQFIIELKRWKGEAGREKAHEQLLSYMDTKNADKGYLLTFDFRKGKNQKHQSEWVKIGNKQIFEVVV